MQLTDAATPVPRRRPEAADSLALVENRKDRLPASALRPVATARASTKVDFPQPFSHEEVTGRSGTSPAPSASTQRAGTCHG